MLPFEAAELTSESQEKCHHLSPSRRRTPHHRPSCSVEGEVVGLHLVIRPPYKDNHEEKELKRLAYRMQRSMVANPRHVKKESRVFIDWYPYVFLMCAGSLAPVVVVIGSAEKGCRMFTTVAIHHITVTWTPPSHHSHRRHVTASTSPECTLSG